MTGQISPSALSVQDLAAELGVSEKTARRMVVGRQVKAYRIRRVWRVLRADFEAYLAKQANVQEAA